ncbi:MAG: hypothetical protein IGR93_04185 [Hydrococcus sp. C42_A2020_068]|nr:hypothetical protein [Hydrococcus sp. C42_A2020_068]
MIRTAEGQVNLKALEELLQKRLNSESSANPPLQIYCVLKEETPIVLIRCPESVIPYPKQIFSLLRQALQEERIWENSPISMYLIWQDQERSEIFDRWLADWQPRKAIGDRDESSLESKNLQKRETKRKSGLLAGTGIGIVLLLGGWYVLTRPCAIGDCPAIDRSALSEVKLSASNQDILEARQQLERTIKTLQAIPGWSRHRRQAEILLADYHKQLASLTKITAAIATTEQATSLAQNFSYPNWEEIRQLCQKAIASLQQVPPESQWYAIAQARKRDYQKKLAGIEQRQQAQSQANTSLRMAQETAKLARIRQKDAQSPADWQLVLATWQTSVRRLREISPQTNTYQQAQRLLAIYTPQLIAVQTRYKQEQSAASSYQKAIEQAKLATDAEAKAHWSAAASNWRSALIYIKQVPRNTFQYRQAEPLIAIYTLAFDRAARLQQTESILQQICLPDNKICNWATADSAIKINLTSSYIQRVWETAIQAQASANWQVQVELLDRIATLEKSLQSLSNHFGKRVEVYNADGRLMIVYQPSK